MTIKNSIWGKRGKEKDKPENQDLDGGREGDGIFGTRRRVGFKGLSQRL